MFESLLPFNKVNMATDTTSYSWILFILFLFLYLVYIVCSCFEFYPFHWMQSVYFNLFFSVIYKYTHWTFIIYNQICGTHRQTSSCASRGGHFALKMFPIIFLNNGIVVIKYCWRNFHFFCIYSIILLYIYIYIILARF